MRLQHSEEALVENHRRTRVACESCHNRKLKCRPIGSACERCAREGTECSFTRAALAAPSDGQRSVSYLPAVTMERMTPEISPNRTSISADLQPQEDDIMADPSPDLPDLFMQTHLFLDRSFLDQLVFPSQSAAYTVMSNPPDVSLDRISDACARLRRYCMPTNSSRAESSTAEIEHGAFIQSLGSVKHLRFDPDIVDIFLNLFHIHMLPVFECFEELFATDITPEDLGIPMAGTGGLYCSTPGAIRMAKAMFNSIRVKLLSKVHHQPLPHSDDRLPTLQLYMLLELFGYLSGDERLLEIGQVYHWEMIQVVDMYNLWQPSGAEWETERKRTIEGICVLECYRVAMLQGSATFSLPLSSVAIAPSWEDINGDTLLAELQWMVSGPLSGPAPQSPNLRSATYTLCGLSLALPWAVSGFNFTSNCPTPANCHRREFLESALNKWSSVAYNHCTLSTQMLFHVISLNIHVNLREAQDIAYRHSAENDNAAPQSTRRATDDPSSIDHTVLADVFPSEAHRMNAAWHAMHVMKLAQDSPRDLDEPPQFAYGVFFAELTLWLLDGYCSSLPAATSPFGIPHEPVVQAMAILSSCASVSVATKFRGILGSLPRACGREGGSGDIG
ncbi:hypothetical protein BJY04DRAFT_221461 [Aspergillus karnatakaensis]|uniref:Zn(II)2Cys6 transcription factor domain-containing protein n=1 Tax=Aspergillus karnatakaensis TaxID=1810916 RepID=UPI003CCD9800